MVEWDNSRPADSFEGPATMIYGDGYPGSPNGPMWKAFQAGAREVWMQVRPLLADPDGERISRKPPVQVAEAVVLPIDLLADSPP